MDKNLARIRHERSVKDFPKLQLDDDEYVELAYGRSRKSLLLAWGGIAAMVVVVLLVMLLLLVSEVVADDVSMGFFLLILLTLAVVAIVAGIGISAVHYGNKLFFTNKRLIQIIVNFPLLESERSINIGAVGHVEYEENTIIEKLLNFGTLKLSTHEKNVMILENMEMKSAMQMFNDNTGSVYAFKDVSITDKDLDEINALISDAPKMGHKSSEDVTRLNSDLGKELEGKEF